MSSCILNNGFTSDYFTIKRGVRQGCPLSALLFILVVEVLADTIRRNKHVKGITVNGFESKITQLADDTTLILKDIRSLQICLKLIQMCFQASGLKLNQTKTEVLCVGRNALYYTNLNPLRLKWEKERVYALGTWFYKDKKKNVSENTAVKLIQIDQLLQNWQGRSLTWYGKITVIKSLVLSKLNYIISTIETPKYFVDEVQRLINEFLWNKKPPRIKFKTAIANHEQGGINLTHVESYVKAPKITWVKKFCTHKKHFVVQRLLTFIPEMVIEDFLCCVADPGDLNVDIPNFYRQILYVWFEHKSLTASGTKSIIWFNKNITINRKYMWKKSWYNKGVTFISDLMDHNGKFLTFADFTARYDINSNFLEYESVKHAIPSDLKQKATDEFSKRENQNVELKVKGSKEIYEKLIEPLKKLPTCFKSWSDQYSVKFNETEWRDIFNLPKQLTKNTKLIEFQCKIVHKVYASNSYVSRFDLTVAENCETCTVKHNTNHFFVICRNLHLGGANNDEGNVSSNQIK